MNKKEGEPSIFYRGAAHLIFIAFVLYVLGVFFIHPEFFGDPGITGYAVYDETESIQKIEDAISGASFMSSVTDANICIQINDDDTIHSFDVVIDSSTVTATQSTDFCKGVSQEDLIIKFNDYEAFTGLMDDFTIANIMRGKGGRDFYVLESDLVAPGGDVRCDAAFKAKYCNAIRSFGTPEQLIEGDLYCCIDAPTKSQGKMTTEHVTASGFTNEIGPIEETPGLALPEFLTSYMFFAVLGGLLLLGVGVVSMRKKPAAGKVAGTGAPAGVAVPAEDPKIVQLRGYVNSMLKAGYPRNQVYQYLQQQGWQTDVLNKVFSPQTQAPPQPIRQGLQYPSGAGRV